MSVWWALEKISLYLFVVFFSSLLLLFYSFSCSGIFSDSMPLFIFTFYFFSSIYIFFINFSFSCTNNGSLLKFFFFIFSIYTCIYIYIHFISLFIYFLYICIYLFQNNNNNNRRQNKHSEIPETTRIYRKRGREKTKWVVNAVAWNFNIFLSISNSPHYFFHLREFAREIKTPRFI